MSKSSLAGTWGLDAKQSMSVDSLLKDFGVGFFIRKMVKNVHVRLNITHDADAFTVTEISKLATDKTELLFTADSETARTTTNKFVDAGEVVVMCPKPQSPNKVVYKFARPVYPGTVPVPPEHKHFEGESKSSGEGGQMFAGGGVRVETCLWSLGRSVDTRILENPNKLVHIISLHTWSSKNQKLVAKILSDKTVPFPAHSGSTQGYDYSTAPPWFGPNGIYQVDEGTFPPFDRHTLCVRVYNRTAEDTAKAGPLRVGWDACELPQQVPRPSSVSSSKNSRKKKTVSFVEEPESKQSLAEAAAAGFDMENAEEGDSVRNGERKRKAKRSDSDLNLNKMVDKKRRMLDFSGRWYLQHEVSSPLQPLLELFQCSWFNKRKYKNLLKKNKLYIDVTHESPDHRDDETNQSKPIDDPLLASCPQGGWRERGVGAGWGTLKTGSPPTVLFDGAFHEVRVWNEHIAYTKAEERPMRGTVTFEHYLSPPGKADDHYTRPTSTDDTDDADDTNFSTQSVGAYDKIIDIRRLELRTEQVTEGGKTFSVTTLWMLQRLTYLRMDRLACELDLWYKRKETPDEREFNVYRYTKELARRRKFQKRVTRKVTKWMAAIESKKSLEVVSSPRQHAPSLQEDKQGSGSANVGMYGSQRTSDVPPQSPRNETGGLDEGTTSSTENTTASAEQIEQESAPVRRRENPCNRLFAAVEKAKSMSGYILVLVAGALIGSYLRSSEEAQEPDT